MTNKEDIMMKIFEEFSSVKGNDRHYILVINGFFEMLVNVLIEEKLKGATEIVKRNYATKLLFIYTTNLIADDLYNALNVFRKIRNRAAHNPLFKVNKSDLLTLPKNYQNPSNFENTCIETFTFFWNTYSTLFSDKFAGGQN